MASPPPRPTRRASGLLLAAALITACSSTRERWAEVGFEGLSFANLYLTVVDLLDAEGFRVRARDPGLGHVESEWLYGTSQRELRGPSRRKVLARLVPREEGGYLVRIRVAEEVIYKGGLLASGLRESDDWEPYHDNFEDAEYLAAKLRALLADHLAGSRLEVVTDSHEGTH